MGIGVFIHRSDSIYDDSPAERYQFPSQYLGRVNACLGDWIIYYEPSKVPDTRGYFAVARVQQVVPDPNAPEMYLALIEPGSYLDFANPVPFKDADGPIERGLLNEERQISGRAQSAVRPISPDDFSRIVGLGLEEKEMPLPRLDEADLPVGFQEERLPFQFEQLRDRITFTVSRVVRDRIFRSNVLRAYDRRCAITGLRIINGRGRAEVAAAHIRPVEANGPDIINNGIALSGTAHWMFDRGLIGLTDDLEVLISRHVNDPESVRALINQSGRAIPPSRKLEQPHTRFLRWHRENRFKQ